eukprot:TRINITY_DN25301_c0_g1_i1.p1 TRINITY_DN25301_c0_g1~~TRINITY_DN25301_c0_g1_i1.p1  ORF type:complete len:239 (+),score=93.16 TRINITY_DN25301_c0_g1_i1:84-719(+)
MAPIATLVHVFVNEGQGDAFIKESLKNASNSVREPGNLRFDALQSADDPCKFVLYEVYERPECIEAHRETAHYKEWRENVAGMMAKPRAAVKHSGIFMPAHSGDPCGERGDQPAVVTLVEVHVKDGAVDGFKQASAKNASNSVQEPGNIRFDAIQQADDPCRFVLVEAYESAEAAAAHKDTAHYKEWRDTVADMMAEPRKGLKHTAVYMPL